MAVVITKDNLEKEIAQSSQPVVVKVHAPWCGPCQHMEPIFASLEKELENRYKFASLNVDDARDVSIKYGITTVPTFLFIKDDTLVAKVTGYMSKEELKARIEQNLA